MKCFGLDKLINENVLNSGIFVVERHSYRKTSGSHPLSDR